MNIDFMELNLNTDYNNEYFSTESVCKYVS